MKYLFKRIFNLNVNYRSIEVALVTYLFTCILCKNQNKGRLSLILKMLTKIARPLISNGTLPLSFTFRPLSISSIFYQSTSSKSSSNVQSTKSGIFIDLFF
jgi:hypothetical protein